MSETTITFTDSFGSVVTWNADDTWTRGGMTVGPCSQEEAARTFSGMAPDGWEPPPVPVIVPASVDLWQAKAVLAQAGLLDKVNAAIAQIGGNPALAWEYGNTITRDSPTLQRLGEALGLTDTDLDKLFIAAAGISI